MKLCSSSNQYTTNPRFTRFDLYINIVKKIPNYYFLDNVSDKNSTTSTIHDYLTVLDLHDFYYHDAFLQTTIYRVNLGLSVLKLRVDNAFIMKTASTETSLMYVAKGWKLRF